MSVELELLSALYHMYSEGELAAEFDKSSNKMINSQKLIDIMKDVKSILPEELGPKEAADKMRNLPEEDREAAIENSKGKVVDMRSHFSRKMSINKGAQGILVQLGDAVSSNDETKIGELLKIAAEFSSHEGIKDDSNT